MGEISPASALAEGEAGPKAEVLSVDPPKRMAGKVLSYGDYFPRVLLSQDGSGGRNDKKRGYISRYLGVRVSDLRPPPFYFVIRKTRRGGR